MKKIFAAIAFIAACMCASAQVSENTIIANDTTITCYLGNTMLGYLVADYEVDLTLEDICVTFVVVKADDSGPAIAEDQYNIDVIVTQCDTLVSNTRLEYVTLKENISSKDTEYTISQGGWNVVMLSHSDEPYQLDFPIKCNSMLLFY